MIPDRRTYAKAVVLSVIPLLGMLLFLNCGKFKAFTRRLQSLDKYRIYDSSVVLDTSAPEKIKDWNTFKWRIPYTRNELLWAEEHTIRYPKKPPIKAEKKLAVKKKARPDYHIPIAIRDNDQLDDFVVEFGEWYHHPDSWDELNAAVRRSAARRTSAFFAQYYGWQKPFLGELPPSFYNGVNGSNSNIRNPNRLQIWKDFKHVDVSLPTPKAPQITIVASHGANGAQKAIYDGTVSPISYQRSPYWAAIYAGSASSTPTVLIIDRITIGKKSAEIVLHRPPRFMGTSDLHPYWFFVPLGRLPEGDYTVNVIETDKEKPLASTTATLRYATADEQSLLNKKSELEQAANHRHFKSNENQVWEKGAELQLRLERLAEFVQVAELTDAIRSLLAKDVELLGEQIFWDKGYHPNQRRGRPLEAPSPGKSPTLRIPLHPIFAGVHPPWKPSNIALQDIWLCDGTDADWFAEQTYRIIPEFQNAFDEANPTPNQIKIKQIWQAIENKIADPKHKRLAPFVAAGTLEDALDMAHKVLVEGQQPIKIFPADTPLWVALIAERSFLVRGIDTGYKYHKRNDIKRTEFRVNASGYIGKADSLAKDHRSPITFALIPLGKLPAGHSVGVCFTCPTLCSRSADSAKQQLLDVKPESLMLNRYCGYLSQSTGFQIEP